MWFGHDSIESWKHRIYEWFYLALDNLITSMYSSSVFMVLELIAGETNK